MTVAVIPFVIGALGTVPKGLESGRIELEIGGRIETIQTTALLRLAKISKRVLVIKETCCHSDSSERPSPNTCVKNCCNDKRNLSRRITTICNCNDSTQLYNQNMKMWIKFQKSQGKINHFM